MPETRNVTLRLTPSLVTALARCGHRELWLRRQPGTAPFVETAASSRGKSLHAALAAFHRQGGAAALSAAGLHELLARHWARASYPDAEAERLARRCSEAELERYYHAFGADAGTLATERSWTLHRELEGLRTEWHGRLDWLRQADDGSLEVIDWKTCQQVPSPEALAADPAAMLQARLARALAARQRNWPTRPVRVSYLYLGTAEKVSVVVTREMIRAAEAELARLARGLRRRDLPATEGPWCAWNGGCPVQQAGQCPLFPPPELVGEWE